MSDKCFRWGFIGCGKISSDFANALKNSKRAILYSCAARSLESAESFAKTHNFEKSYASYEQLVQDPKVDIVYIGTLHISHYEHTLLALTHRKHVLVEKPMTMNATQAAHVLSVARQHECFCMEGMWTRFFPAVRYVRKLLSEHAIGVPHHVNAEMGFFFEPDNQRMWDRKLGGGGLLDIGIYPLAFTTMIFGGHPTRVDAVGQLSEGVDVVGAITLQYPTKNQFATVQYSCIADFMENTTIIGTKGRIIIHGPSHCPTKVTIQQSGTRDQVMLFPHPEPHPNVTKFNFGGSVGLLYEAEAVMSSIERGELEHPEYSLQESLELQILMEGIRKQLLVVYDSDK